MFDVLVESNATKGQAAKQSAYFGTTAVVLFSIFVAVIVWSLYSVNLGLGEEDLALDTLVAPVAVPDNAPPPPPAPDTKPQKQTSSEDAPKNFDVRPVLQKSVDESPSVPDKVSTTANTVASRREGVPTKIGTSTANATGTGPAGPPREGGGGGGPAIAAAAPPPKADADEPPPPPAATPKPTPKAPSVISGGVVNGKARNLVTPPYPPAAKAVHAAGAVNVQVLIDEAGNVVSASATSGHPLLRAAAVQAARSSKFTPTQLSGQPVKVTGVIVYNFTGQ